MIPFYDQQQQQIHHHSTPIGNGQKHSAPYFTPLKYSGGGGGGGKNNNNNAISGNTAAMNMKDTDVLGFSFQNKLSLVSNNSNSSNTTIGSGGSGGAIGINLTNGQQSQQPQHLHYHSMMSNNNSNSNLSKLSSHISYASGDFDSNNFEEERLLDEQSQQLQKSLDLLSDSDESVPFSMNNMYFSNNHSINNLSNIKNSNSNISSSSAIGGNALHYQPPHNNNSMDHYIHSGQGMNLKSSHQYQQQQQPQQPSTVTHQIHPHHQLMNGGNGQDGIYSHPQSFHLPQLNPVIQQPLHHHQHHQQQTPPLHPQHMSFKSYDLLPNDFLHQAPPPQHHQYYGNGGYINGIQNDYNNNNNNNNNGYYSGTGSNHTNGNGLLYNTPPAAAPIQKQPPNIMKQQPQQLPYGNNNNDVLSDHWSSVYTQTTPPMMGNSGQPGGFYQSPIFTNYSHSAISPPQDLLLSHGVVPPTSSSKINHQHQNGFYNGSQQQQQQQQQQQPINDSKHRPFNPLVAPFQPTSTKNTAFAPISKQQQQQQQQTHHSIQHGQQIHHNQYQHQNHNSNQQQQHYHQQHSNNNNQIHKQQKHQDNQHQQTTNSHSHQPQQLQQHHSQPIQQQQLHQHQREKEESSYDQVDPELDNYHGSGNNNSIGNSKTVVELKRGEMVESPISRQQYKHFIKQFKLKEKEGLEVAMSFASKSLETLSEKVHWRVYLELADLANRQNNLKLARKYYRMVTKTQPYISQGWLEYAKMEEDYGRLEKCQQILQLGLKYCPFNESLLIKGIRHEEKMDNLEGARALLSQLRDQSIFKTWRAVMEGGLLEARAGNIEVARKIFKYLMKHVPWYGPIYQEAYKLEERCEEYERAIAIVEKGLLEDPKYGPLWFSALRLYEKTSHGYLELTRSTVERARQSVSREVTWKVYFEAAQIEERSHNLDLARAAYVKSVELCPENLLWKVWLGGSRTELNADNINVARKLVFRALQEVPAKLKSLVLLEYSRLEEYAGNINKSRRILKMAHVEARLDWKVFLESVLLEMRANNYEAAIQEAKESLKIHSGAGRLWAALIQLNQLRGSDSQLKVFKKALQFVPKSGEVWCEGARIALNNNELDKAKRFLEFAVQFTPQFGDSFIELLRLELMEKGPNCDISKLEQLCINADPNYGFMWLHCTVCVLDSPRQVLRNAKKLLVEMTPSKEDYGKAKDERYGSCWVGANGVLSLNRVFRNDFNKMTNEERRKCMFGSDLVKP